MFLPDTRPCSGACPFGPRCSAVSPLFLSPHVFSGPSWGWPFRLVSELPPVRHRPGLGTGCTVLFLGSPCSLSPFVFLAPRSCPVRRSCFRYPARPASVPRAPCAALRLLLPLVFAARPTVRASFLPSASPRSHVSHMCPHSMASPQLLAQLGSCFGPLVGPRPP